MFVLGVNLPLKPSDFLNLKYKDLFDKRDNPKYYELQLGRYLQSDVIKIPLKSNVKNFYQHTEKNINYFIKPVQMI